MRGCNEMQITVQCTLSHGHICKNFIIAGYDLQYSFTTASQTFSWVLGEGVYSHESIQGSSYYLLHPNIPSTHLSRLLICGISKYLQCYDGARLSYATKFAILKIDD